MGWGERACKKGADRRGRGAMMDIDCRDETNSYVF